jgi:hypothetical protein
VAGKSKAKRTSRDDVEQTTDGHYIVIDGRRWRATDPSIPEPVRQQLVKDLMQARRDVGRALRENDSKAEREARSSVNRLKIALGERGPKWWEKKKGSGKARQ